jgi:hypothetical protein
MSVPATLWRVVLIAESPWDGISSTALTFTENSANDPSGRSVVAHDLSRFVSKADMVVARAERLVRLRGLHRSARPMMRDFRCRSSPMDARAEVPAFPKTSGYPAVADLPPKREKPAMTADERLKLQKELTAARARQAPKARRGTASPQPMKKP